MAKRTWIGVLVVLASACVGCVETVRCDEGEIFSPDGECGPIPDAGPSADAGPDSGS